jgi:predicted house-cleaning NTP pyrophosphatase (Maf/HAM1 superfamily)
VWFRAARCSANIASTLPPANQIGACEISLVAVVMISVSSSNPSQVNGLPIGLAIDAGGFITAIRNRCFWF